ncbi:MXAN_5187 C-terminal domain-containing protein [Geobacter argillaceus]|uniref:Uncharacterized protein n=1 Tax=Geobacter argillaceus TaxID=345631 RepID=A0A562WSQ3_9BACT|nr:MXAN_5187 C-terminal domain-containing protein [Geobacter argillaceus]TWJ33420.1 hypothetical protein JN12_00094 [Geobacter argillaceus]
MGVQEDIYLFEQRLNDLVVKYEQYFLGLEKREPLKLLDDVERQSRKYATTKISNTMLKFRYNSLVARFSSYRQYWGRIIRLIEEGKYSRDRAKMARHALLPPAPEPVSSVPPEAEQVYRDYLAARRACNLNSGTISPEKIADLIAQQQPLIQKRYGTDRITFVVVIENGVPKIKARPQR